MRCFQCGKVNKFESDSQLKLPLSSHISAVSSVAKLINLKAIHNIAVKSHKFNKAVSSVAKLINLKAIHNQSFNKLI